MKIDLKFHQLIKMETEINITFQNILVSSKYNTNDYREVVMKINKKSYLVKIPNDDIASCITSNNIIRYRLEHTIPPKKRGRKRIYPTDNACR
jgi:hypothetical protein